MKNKKLALYATSLALAGGMLAGCKGKNKEVTLDKVTFGGIASTYKTEDTISWDDMVVTFSYSDNTAISFTSDKMEFDVDTPVKSETELIVKTQGLHSSVAPHEEGRYYITVAKKDDFTKFYDAGSIAVGLISKDKYALIEYALPRNITAFQEVAKDAGKDEEGSFKKFNDDFIVGTINPWQFEPVASFAEKADLAKIDDFTNYEKEEKLYVVNGTQETEVSSSDYARIVIGGGKYQFASQDAGKRFRIVVSPKEFKKDAMGASVSPVSFSFNVMEGYNIYNAKQLGVLNLTNLKSEEFVGNYAFAEHYRVATATLGEAGNGQSRVFITKPGEADPYGRLDLPRVWEKFLRDNGVLTTSTVAAARDVKGVFLQNDINITPKDIPNEYFINENDPSNATNGYNNNGALRDDTSIYVPTTMNELTISGNYFKLDSSAIPLCKNTTDGATCDALGGYPIVSFTNDWSQSVAPGHATLIKVCGVNFGDEVIDVQKYPETVKPATIKNLLTVGNTGSDISGAEGDLDKKMKVTGLIFAKATKAPVTMDNIILQEYMIGLFADNGLGQAIPGVAEHKSYTFVKDCKVFDCSNSGLFNYEDGGLEVSGTTMRRFGGACIINAGCSGENGYKEASHSKFSSDCDFYNPVTGGEVYFAAVGAAGYISQITAYNQFFTQKQMPSKKSMIGPEGDKDEGKMNLVALQMDGGGYVFADNGIYAGTLEMGRGNKSLKVELGENQAKLEPLCAWATTETGDSFLMPSSGDHPAAATAAAKCALMKADLLDLDICLGKTVLSCVFDLFDVPQAK